MRTTNQMNVAGLTLAALSGMAIAQSGLDLDRAYAAELRADADSRRVCWALHPTARGSMSR